MSCFFLAQGTGTFNEAGLSLPSSSRNYINRGIQQTTSLLHLDHLWVTKDYIFLGLLEQINPKQTHKQTMYSNCSDRFIKHDLLFG